MLKFSTVARRSRERDEDHGAPDEEDSHRLGFKSLTLPVAAIRRVPEVVADFPTGHPPHRMCRLQRVQNNPVLLHLPPVHLNTPPR